LRTILRDEKYSGSPSVPFRKFCIIGKKKLIRALRSGAKPRFTKGIQTFEKLWITLCTNVRKFAKQACQDSSTLFIRTALITKTLYISKACEIF
jgi:hypothetical protein